MDIIYEQLFGMFKLLLSIRVYKDVITHPFMNSVAEIALMLVKVFAMGALIFQGYKILVHNKGNVTDVIIRVLLVVIILTVYPNVFLKIVDFADDISLSLLQLSEVSEQLQNVSMNPEAEDTRAWYQKVGDFFNVNKVIDNTITALLVEGSIFLAGGAILIVLIVRNISLSILILIGPILLVCSISESTRSYFNGWIKSFINVILWPVLIAFLLFIENVIFKKMFIYSNADFLECKSGLQYFLFAYNSVYIIFIIKIMKFIPALEKGSAGSFSSLEGLLSLAAFTAGKKGLNKLSNVLKGNKSDVSAGSGDSSSGVDDGSGDRVE